MKKFVKLSVVLSALALPMSALADSLTIVNNTNAYITSTVNPGTSGSLCSSSMPGGYGITPPHSTKSIPSLAVVAACGFSHQHDCKADIHLSNDCSGPAIGRAMFDTSKGILEAGSNDTNYHITYSGFTATIDPISAVASR